MTLTLKDAEAAYQAARAEHDKAREAVEVTQALLNQAKREWQFAQHAAEQEREAARKRDERKARDKARRLATQYGIELERERDLDSNPWFVSHPDLLDTPRDPYEGDHYVHSWCEVLQRVEGYVSALTKGSA